MNRTDVVIHGSRNQSSFTYKNDEHDYVSAKKMLRKERKRKFRFQMIRQIEVYHDKLRFSV